MPRHGFQVRRFTRGWIWALVLALGPISTDWAEAGAKPSTQQVAPSLADLKLKVGVVQFPIDKPTTETEFLAKVEKSIVDCRKWGAKLVVLPELVVLDQLVYSGSGESKAAEIKQIEKLATDFFPRYVSFLKKLSAREKVDILGGSAPRRVGERIRNTAVLILRGRSEPIFQDKLFPTPEEVAWGWEGGDELVIVPTAYGNWVTLICYDAQFAALSNLLANQFPTLILVPSMTTKEGLARVRFAAQARAVEHHAYVVVAGVVSGKSPHDLEYFGQNLVVPPQEKGFSPILAEGPLNVPAATGVELDFRKLARSRETTGLYSARDFQKRISSGAIRIKTFSPSRD